MKALLTSIALCFALASWSQQESQYTQNQFNSNLQINPAYAGANESSSLSMRYRKQWTGFSGSPGTFAFNGETKVNKRNLATGISFIRDEIGILQSTSIDLSLAVHIRLTEKSKLAVGLKGGAYFLNSNFSKLRNVDLTDPLYADNKRTVPYVGLGLLYYTEKLYAGFSVPRMVSFEKTSVQSKVNMPHYYLYGGYRITLNEELELRPAILGKYEVSGPFEMDFALAVWYKNAFAIGMSYRTSDAVNLLVKARVGQLHLGYSYDMTVSRLRTFNTGSHEIFLGFEFGKKGNPNRNQNNRYF